ncbi:MAG: pitrilysin family protein [Acidobacteriota bacterium]
MRMLSDLATLSEYKVSIKRAACAALLIGLISPALHAQAPAVAVAKAIAAPPAPAMVTSVEGITEYRLTNGFRVLLFPDASKPTLTVNVTYLVGSRHEGYGETGMAHLLEHMLFKGTQRRNEIMGELRAHGADFNGSTWFDRTNYFETFQATDDNLRWALDLEADRMVNSRVSRQDLDTEMTVVRNEFESGENNPSSVLYERVLSTAYLWHNYGHSTIGARSDIENVPIPRLQAFYHKYYQPDNAVLVVAGKFDPAKTLGWINELFGVLPKPTRVLDQEYTAEPPQDGEREVVLRRVGDTQALIIGYHIPAASHPDSAAFDVLSFILGDSPSGRLHKALVETKKATSVSADEMEVHDPGMFLVSAELLKDQNFADVESTVLKIIDGVATEPPSKVEVDRAKTRILKNFELAMNDPSSLGVALSETIGSGDWRLLFLGRDELEKVTPEDVARVAQKYLVASNRTTGRFFPVSVVPKRADIPAAPNLALTLEGYKGKPPVEAGEAFDPSPANIETRVSRITLPSGIKLVLLPKKTRGGTVVASMQFHFGSLNALMNKGIAPSMAGSMLMRGTTKHTRQQLHDEFDRLKAQVGVDGGTSSASASINTVRAGLIDSLKLAAEILQQPSFPESDFEEVRLAGIAELESQRSEPQTIASIARNKHIYPYPASDPRAVLSIDESIAQLKAVTLDQAKQFYKDFYGASNGEIAIVGDFDPTEVRTLLGQLFGNWKSPKPYQLITRDWSKIAPVNQMFEAPDKANAYFTAITTIAMDQQDPDYPLLFLANQMIGGDSKSRLWKRIRESEGLSYGVNSGFSAGATEKLARFSAGAIANPENVLKVEAAFKDELAKLLAQGFTAEEVAIAKSAYLQDSQISRAQDGTLASQLARQAELGRTMQREINLENAIRNATVAQLNAVVKKWIDPSTISYFKAGDFKKAGVTK